MIRRVVILFVMVTFLMVACSTPTAVPEPTLVQVTPLATDTPVPPTAIPPTIESTPTTEVDPTATAIPLDPWADVTETTIGVSENWTNKVELADINGDGLVDILFANGGFYDSPDDPTLSQVFLNRGPDAPLEDVSVQVLGSTGMLARVMKVRDVNNDGIADIMVGTTFQTQSRLWLGEGDGRFTEVTTTHLPQQVASVGDLEFGDVDNDGDLDMVLADWGRGSPMGNLGGRTLLWLNDGTGVFTDVTDEQMPEDLVKFSWELEFVDVDNDYDLDIVVSCKKCLGNFLFENDGSGKYVNVSDDRLPLITNNYDFEAIDMNGDTFLDLVSINDGSRVTEHLFLNNGLGGFTFATDDFWPEEDNLAYADDNMVAYLDFESDGDADILVGSLSHQDRLLINDGQGHLKLLDAPRLYPGHTPGTLGIALADLNGDHRLDIVEAQGEAAFANKVYFGQAIEPDTAPPIITLVLVVAAESPGQVVIVRARIHDNKSPTVPHDWQSVVVRWSSADGQSGEAPMQWYGEYLWRATLENGVPTENSIEVCAIDAAGNEACAAAQ